jgi:hypothetical protein
MRAVHTELRNRTAGCAYRVAQRPVPGQGVGPQGQVRAGEDLARPGIVHHLHGRGRRCDEGQAVGDGSHEVARLNALSAAVSGPLGRAHEMREQADVIPHRIAVSRRRAHRASMEAITRAGRPLCAAGQAISAARAAHQGTGPHGSPACDPNQHEHVAGYHDPESAPKADLRALRAALEHIDTDLPPGPA